MKLRHSLFAAALAATTSTTALAEAWDMPTPYGDSVFHTQNIIQFADDVRSATGGELDITVHSAGSLFGHAEIKDSVRRGLAPIGELLISRLSNENPVFGVDSIPFLAASYADAGRLWEASRPHVASALQEQGLTLLFAVPWPGQSLYLNEEVTDPAQLQGVSFRAYNAATERLAQLLGMVPTQVESGDIPTAFSTGRVAAMMTSPSTGVSSQAWDFTSHYVDVQAWLPKNMVVVNSAAFQALSNDVQAAVLAAAAEAETRGWAMSEAETTTRIATLVENGMHVGTASDELAAALQAVGATMTQEWAAQAGEAGTDILGVYGAN